VFAVTTIWSIVAYIWLYVVLIDGIVKEWEAYVTLGCFFVLILMAYTADCLRARTMKKREDLKYGHEKQPENMSQAQFNDVKTLDAKDFFKKLIPLEQGKAVEPED